MSWKGLPSPLTLHRKLASAFWTGHRFMDRLLAAERILAAEGAMKQRLVKANCKMPSLNRAADGSSYQFKKALPEQSECAAISGLHRVCCK